MLKKTFLIGFLYLSLFNLTAQEVITLIAPEDEHQFELHELGLFRWGGPINPAPDQVMYYTVRVVICEDMDPEIAMNTQPYWLEKTTNPGPYHGSMSTSIDEPFTFLTKHAWQVTRYDEFDNIIGLSPIYTFTSCYPFERILADDTYIDLTSLEILGDDRYSGEGTFLFFTEPEIIEPVVFDSILLIQSGGANIMTEGEIVDKLDSISEMPFTPNELGNSEGTLFVDSIKFERYNTKVKGHFQCEANFPTSDETDTLLISKNLWNNTNFYDNAISCETQYEEMVYDEFFPKLTLLNTSHAYLSNSGQYYLNLEGVYSFNDLQGEEIQIPFETNKSDLTYLHNSEPFNLNISSSLNLNIQVNNSTIDCSTDTSFNYLSDSALWTGICIDTAKVSFAMIDHPYIEFEGNVVSDFISNSPSVINKYDSSGLHFNASIETEKECTIYGFTGNISQVNLSIENSIINDDLIRGSIDIPYLSESNYEFSISSNDSTDTIILDNMPERFYFPTGENKIDTIFFVSGQTVLPFTFYSTSEWNRFITLPDSSNLTGVFDFVLDANNIIVGELNENQVVIERQLIRGETEVCLANLMYVKINTGNQYVSYRYRVGYYSVNEYLQPIKIDTYPNPFTDQLNILIHEVLNKATVTVYDISGKIQICQNIEDNTTTIDLSKFPKGTYILEICNNNYVSRKKITKQQ